MALAGCSAIEAPRDAPRPGAERAPGPHAPPPGSQEPGRPAPRYHAVAITGARALAGLQGALGPERFATVLKLNRRSPDRVFAGDTLVVPDSSTLALDSAARMPVLSPFPRALRAARAPDRLLLVSLRVQAFAAYQRGALARWGPVSTGRETLPTPAARYHVNWKARRRTSTVNPEWLLDWCVNIENRLGLSLHEFDLPGYPASHACVRLLEDDARWIYDWVEGWTLGEDRRVVVEPGTPVVVFGRYAWRERPPWKRLPEDPKATEVTAGEVEEALRRHVPEALAPADSLVAARGRPDSAGAEGTAVGEGRGNTR